MAKESVTEVKPPYLTYGTFRNLINGFRESVLPARIDRSVMAGKAGGVQTYLLSALKFFGLIDDSGIPTNDFRILIDEGDEQKRKTEWKRIVERSYDFIFTDGINLATATESQLHEKFKAKGLDGATLRKCHTFFSNAAEEAGIILGPHAKSSAKSSGGAVRSGTRKKKKTDNDGNGNGAGGGASSGVLPKTQSNTASVREMILAKFPDFDPGWPPALKEAWFKDFSELRKWGEETK